MSQHDSLIGARVRRVEDPRLLCGGGRYAGDLRPDGLLHASFARSYFGHARIASISLDSARAMPGVVAVLSARDLPELQRPLPATFAQPGLSIRMPTPLESTEVRYAGEAIAVVFAETAYQAADAVEAIEVEYEPLDAVVDPEEALYEAAPRVHFDVEGNVAGTGESGIRRY